MNPRDECEMWARAADNYREQSEKFRRERDEARRIAGALYRVLLVSEAYMSWPNVRGVRAFDLLVEMGRARRIIGR